VNASLTGVVLGFMGGTGLAVAISRIPILRRHTLEDRVGPYLRDPSRPARSIAEPRALTPFPTLERLLRPALRSGARAIGAAFGGAVTARRRLDYAGSALSVEQFRIEQLSWAAVGMLGGIVVSLLLLAEGRQRHPAVLGVLVLLAACTGLVARDLALTRQVRQRGRRIVAELPTIAELLALSVSAGEGVVGAIDRVARLGRGDLVAELRRALAETRAGAPLSRALDGVAVRTPGPAVGRFIDGIIIALDRGTPLADVLRAQAGDVREAYKRALLEEGGRREIAMMLPVVFLIMPVTVIFALFPGFYGLTFTTS
jgi:tight adherence protein C